MKKRSNLPKSRLYRMGIEDKNGHPEILIIATLSSVYSACLFEDMKESYGTIQNAKNVYLVFSQNADKRTAIELCEALLQEYKSIGQELPKTICDIKQNVACLQCYVSCFIENFYEFIEEERGCL